MSLLRKAAHARHQIFSASLWWWCPPMHTLSSAMHTKVVDTFYNNLEGGFGMPPFLLDEDEEYHGQHTPNQ